MIHNLLTRAQWAKLCLALLDAAQELIKHNICHSDYKPDNVLVQFIGSKVVPVIIDFGLAVDFTEKVELIKNPDFETQCPHIAPELFENHYSTSDLGSLWHCIHHQENTVLHQVSLSGIC